MKKRATEISIQFKQPPLLIFNRMQSSGPCQEIQPNLLTIRIQPDEGIALRFGAKVPTTPEMAVCPVNMDFDYAAAFGKIERQRLRAAAAGRDAGRPDAVFASRWRGDQLGAVHADSAGVGGQESGSVPATTLPARGDRIAPTGCWSGRARVAEQSGRQGLSSLPRRLGPTALRAPGRFSSLPTLAFSKRWGAWASAWLLIFFVRFAHGNSGRYRRPASQGWGTSRPLKRRRHRDRVSVSALSERAFASSSSPGFNLGTGVPLIPDHLDQDPVREFALDQVDYALLYQALEDLALRAWSR